MKPLLRPPSSPVFSYSNISIQIRWWMIICLPCHVHLLVGFFVFVFFFFSFGCGLIEFGTLSQSTPYVPLGSSVVPLQKNKPTWQPSRRHLADSEKEKKREKFNFQDFRILVPTFSVHIRRPHAHMALNDSHIYSRRDRGFIKGERKKRARKCIKIYFFFLRLWLG